MGGKWTDKDYHVVSPFTDEEKAMHQQKVQELQDQLKQAKKNLARGKPRRVLTPDAKKLSNQRKAAFLAERRTQKRARSEQALKKFLDANPVDEISAEATHPTPPRRRVTARQVVESAKRAERALTK